jgi:hypothetical protein
MFRHNLYQRGIGVLILVVVMLLPASILGAQEDDSYTLPPTLNTDETISASFEEDVTTALYALTASAGDTLTITMTRADESPLDPYLVLLDSNGAVLAADDDSGESEFAAQISTFDVPEDGVYLVLATSFFFIDGTEDTSDEQLGYELRASGAPETASENLDLTTERIRYGDSMTATSDIETPVVPLSFVGSEGDSVTIALEDYNFFTNLHLFAPSGERIATHSDTIDITLPEDGVYLILASDLFFFEALSDDTFYTGGAFTLTLNATS